MVRNFYRQFFFLFALLLLWTSCSINPFSNNRNEELYGELGFKVLSSSQEKRPQWISHPHKYSENKGRLYFSYEIDPKPTQAMACAMARAYIKQDLAQLVNLFFLKGYEDMAWHEEVFNLAYDHWQSFFQKAQLENTYWEKRLYPSFEEEGEQSSVCAIRVSVAESEFLSQVKALQRKVKSKIKQLQIRLPKNERVENIFDGEGFLLFYKMNY